MCREKYLTLITCAVVKLEIVFIEKKLFNFQILSCIQTKTYNFFYQFAQL